MKLALVVYLASWLTNKGSLVANLKEGLWPFGLLVGAIFGLTFKEPDLGTATVIAVTALGVFFIAGGNLLQLAGSILGAFGVAWAMAEASTYQQQRIEVFLNPWKYQTGAGYHAVQALMALGSGGLFGRALGDSVQKNILPAPHTDSILAVIGEEFGLVGTLFVLLLFMLIAYRGMRASVRAPDNFGRLLAAGITCWITFQALMNFAVITSSVPFTGVPLPFVSYGGTSLIITMIAMGILLNISGQATGEVVARQDTDHRRGNRRSRLSRIVDNPVPADIPRPGREKSSRRPGLRPDRRAGYGNRWRGQLGRPAAE
jgi:cell division protein FtsW